MKRQEFKEDEIPYSLLEPFGLSQDMLEDLPAGMQSGILAGRPSPLLPITITTDDGQTIKILFVCHAFECFTTVITEEI